MMGPTSPMMDRRTDVLERLAAGLSARAARHITTGELDSIIGECQDSLVMIKASEQDAREADCAARRVTQLRAAATEEGGAPGDREAAFIDAGRLCLYVDHAGHWDALRRRS